VMNHASLFMEAVQHAMQTHNVMVPSMQVRILPAELGDLAGLYGAAFTIVQQAADF